VGLNAGGKSARVRVRGGAFLVSSRLCVRGQTMGGGKQAVNVELSPWPRGPCCCSPCARVGVLQACCVGLHNKLYGTVLR